MNLSDTELWFLIGALSVTAYLLKAVGFVVVGGRTMPAALERCLALIPASLLAALVVKTRSPWRKTSSSMPVPQVWWWR